MTIDPAKSVAAILLNFVADPFRHEPCAITERQALAMMVRWMPIDYSRGVQLILLVESSAAQRIPFISATSSFVCPLVRCTVITNKSTSCFGNSHSSLSLLFFNNSIFCLFFPRNCRPVVHVACGRCLAPSAQSLLFDCCSSCYHSCLAFF